MYICHRSGFYKSKGQHIRHLKTRGHTTDLGHVNLNALERQTLAVQIASKVPFEKILDDVRESINGTLERCHLLTKKYLHNIERSLNLNSDARRHSNDSISVEAWVKEMENTGIVLFYKPQAECCNEYTSLKNDDCLDNHESRPA
ncbi:hypothetical protein HUJ05_001811 [Dendroctonus ponderosae]|nr:hypothetical protein HUJ05_001811 [Dendroctonus ponderosae]